MKINDNKPVPNRVENLPQADAGRVKAANAETQAATAAQKPAVTVNLNDTSAALAVKASDQTTDVELLDQIRERVKNGEFEVDYQKVSQSILRDALASVGARQKKQG